MITTILKGRGARAAAALTVAATGLTLLQGGSTPAHADPAQLVSPIIAVGSDTIQDVTNGLAGVSNDIDYTPLHSSQATGRSVITSWDAVPPAGSTVTCISPKAPGASFTRPNGSGQGQAALSRAIDGGNWGGSCGSKPVSGLITMARSSGGPGAAGNALTFIPFGRDGVSYAYYTTGAASAITDFTEAELHTIYSQANTTKGTDVVRGTVTTHVIPCTIQSGSGTRKFFEGAVSISAQNDTDAGAFCNQATGGPESAVAGDVEENQPAKLKAKGDAIAAAAPGNGVTADNEYIVAISAGSFIAQSNGVSPNNLGTGVDVGSISDDGSAAHNNLGKPYTVSGGVYSPVGTFYNNATFGRNVYYVFDTNKVGPGTLGNAGLKSMFVGSSSLICQSAAQTIVNKFGFQSLSSGCGDNTSFTSALVTNPSGF